MLTSIALIISSITSCVCIVLAVRQTYLANRLQKYYDQQTATKEKLIKKTSDQFRELFDAKNTLQQVRNLVTPGQSESEGDKQ